MTEKRNWFQRPLAAFCLLTAITILSAYIILNPEEKREAGGGEISYRITLRHYGTDAHEMESSAAIPLEDALSAIPGINRIMTMSENNRVRAFINFRKKRGLFHREEEDYYDAVREAAQRVYETLPSSAQRPELSSSADSRVPFWTAAVYAADGGKAPDGALLEQTIKPALNSIEGVGEVEIAGPGIKEILILLDEERTASMGLSPGKIAGVLASGDALFSGGSLRSYGLEIPVQVDGRYADLQALGEARIPLGNGASVALKALGEIREAEREAETISRLNGKKTAVISVTAASGADTRLLSGRIKKEMEKFSSLPLEIRVLEDRGAGEAAAFRSVLIAALQASVLVALSSVFLGQGKSTGFRSNLICAGAIPLISIISAALLVAMGFQVNRKLLAGLAIGIGGAAYAVILCAEGFGRAEKASDGAALLRGIWPPLISGAATTIAALLPLAETGAAGEITIIAAALGTVTLVSAVLALTLLPPLFLWKKRPGVKENSPIFKNAPLPAEKIKHRYSRFPAGLIRFSGKQPFVFPALSLLISAAAVLSLAAAGADTAGEWAHDSVYVQIEFESGRLKEEQDPLLASWAEDLCRQSFIRDVQTGVRTGSGYALVTFDPAKTGINEIRNLIRSKTIPGAFIFIPEPSPKDRIWNIAASGDESEKCREIVRAAASIISSGQSSVPEKSAHFPVKETVLNFKQGGPRLTLYPKRESLAQAGIFFSSPADTVRRGVHGPVAYKRTGTTAQSAGRETDVRVKFRNVLTGDDVIRMPLAGSSAAETVRAGALMEAVKTQEVSLIQRENRRRTASFSVRTDPGDPGFFRDRIMSALKVMELPPGYKIEFDPEAIRRAEAISGKFLNFILAVLLCYMVIAAVEESFVLPLIILSSIPPSLAIPVLVLVITGAPVNAEAACALVAVSGMTVNASVISAGELWRSGLRGSKLTGSETVFRLLANRLPLLLATSGTAIAGGLPFLFLSEGNNALVKTLALVTVLGVGTSFICSLTLVPSWMNLYFRFHKPVPHGGAQTV